MARLGNPREQGLRVRALLAAASLAAACSRPPQVLPEPLPSEPAAMPRPAPAPPPAEAPARPSSSPLALSASAPPPPRPAPVLVEDETPRLTCADPSPTPGGALGFSPRACIIRGLLMAVREKITPLANGTENQSFYLEIEPTPDNSCVTPLDREAKALAEPEANYSDRVVAMRVELAGGRRLLGELRPRRKLCGWIKIPPTPGLPGGSEQGGWEGSLRADGSLLLAGSTYLDPKHSRMLAREWTFAREGPGKRDPISEGGAFVEHPFVRVGFGGRKVRVGAGEELLPLADGGHFAVRIRSHLTTGPTPVFTGNWDGYAFSALRVP